MYGLVKRAQVAGSLFMIKAMKNSINEKSSAPVQVSTYLDRGWYMAQHADWESAASSARQALALDAESPEAHNLLGYSMALSGEHDQALCFYERSIELDDSFVEALLNAAELCIFPLQDFTKALEFCERALPLVENDEEQTDALLLKFDALIGIDDTAGALKVCQSLPVGPYANPEHDLLIGRAYFELKDYERAESRLRDAESRDSSNADAPYYLGMILDEKGDSRGATSAFLRSRKLDIMEEKAPWVLSADAFSEVTTQAVSSLAPHLRSALDLQEVYPADCPGVEVVAEGADPRAPVLIDVLEGPGPLLRAFVYQRNIERLAGSAERMGNEVRSALERELASAAFDEELSEPKKGSTLN